MGDEEATPAIALESLITRVPGHRLGRHVVFTQVPGRAALGVNTRRDEGECRIRYPAFLLHSEPLGFLVRQELLRTLPEAVWPWVRRASAQ